MRVIGDIGISERGPFELSQNTRTFARGVDGGLDLPEPGKTPPEIETKQAPLAYGKADALNWTAPIYRRFGKRVFDISFACLILPVVLPMIALLWALTRCDGGPGFFGHVRVGRHGKAFRCWKIRTMVVNAEQQLQEHLARHPQARAEWHATCKLKTDPRITRFGALLRQTSLDELPQIWNVLKGEMSFVGPRPVVHKEILRYGPKSPAYLALRPGITGIWQVSGRNNVSYGERVDMDVDYLSGMSLLLDVKLVGKTAGAVIMRTGH